MPKGRPVSAATRGFLAWVQEQVQQEGKKALPLIWDKASRQVWKEVKSWVRAQKREARKRGGVWLIVCPLPT